jgi:hypothetical protein
MSSPGEGPWTRQLGDRLVPDISVLTDAKSVLPGTCRAAASVPQPDRQPHNDCTPLVRVQNTHTLLLG